MTKKKEAKAVAPVAKQPTPYLSFSSIHKMVTDPKTWYEEKFLKQYKFEFNQSYVVGGAVHDAIDKFNKWQGLENANAYLYMHAEIAKFEEQNKEHIEQSIIDTMKKEIDNAIENYAMTDPLRAPSSEETLWADIASWYGVIFNARVDAIFDNYIEDYKVVKSFTDPDGGFMQERTYAKYVWQGHFYMLAYQKQHHKKLEKFVITEILKGKPNLMRCDKSTLIAMAEENWNSNVTGTKEEIIAKYKLEAKTVNRIEIPRDEVMMEIVVDQFITAANMYNVIKDMWPKVLLYSMEKLYDKTYNSAPVLDLPKKD